MISPLAKIFVVLLVIAFAAIAACSQSPETRPSFPDRIQQLPTASDDDSRRGNTLYNGADNRAATIAKLKAERDKKDHQEMLDRGDQALVLANQLEAAFERNNGLSREDRVRLETLENIVEKIRKELGGRDSGDDDSENDGQASDGSGEGRPSTLREGFKYLQSSTVRLVEELKKTTRFSISAAAIQTSNSVLKIVKFLRLRK